MNKEQLIRSIREKKSFLCVGLDTDIKKIPKFFLDHNDPVFEFNKTIIDHTKDYAVAYKLNLAFYESLGISGWNSLEKTIDYIPENIFKIADAKRGDIGNTSQMYAKTFFNTYNFDAVTVSPYMGEDSISPFLEFEDKWVIVLALTSNKGSNDFQLFSSGHEMLYERVLKTVKTWGSENNIMFVVGATHPEAFSDIRKIIPDHFILIPGVGTQGGDLHQISKYALNQDVGVLVNVSRGIIYPESALDFPLNVKEKALMYQKEMADYI